MKLKFIFNNFSFFGLINFFLIFLLKANFLFGQNTINVIYENNVNGKILHSVMIFDEQEKSFLTLDPTYRENQKSTITHLGEDEISLHINKSTEIVSVLYKNNDSLTYLSYIPTKDKKIEVYDVPPKMKWDIHPDDKKQILGYECIKATTVFRGTKIIAYFTTSIPTVFGPYKFDGLPGLVLEVIDANPGMNNSTKAIEIRLNSNNDVQSLELNSNYIDYKTFIVEAEKQAAKEIQEFTKKMSASLPRGATTKNDGVLNRTGYEKTYEWEEEK